MRPLRSTSMLSTRLMTHDPQRRLPQQGMGPSAMPSHIRSHRGEPAWRWYGVRWAAWLWRDHARRGGKRNSLTIYFPLASFFKEARRPAEMQFRREAPKCMFLFAPCGDPECKFLPPGKKSRPTHVGRQCQGLGRFFRFRGRPRFLWCLFVSSATTLAHRGRARVPITSFKSLVCSITRLLHSATCQFCSSNSSIPSFRASYSATLCTSSWESGWS